MPRRTRSERVAHGAGTLTKLLLTAFVLLSSYAAPDATAQRRAPRKTAGKTPAAKPSTAASASHEYACPMHPDVTSKTPGGKCPKCGMKLTKRTPSTGGDTAAAESGAATATKAGVTADVGAMQIPDVPVTDQDGKRLNFYQDLVKGKTVAINFIFTTCTTVCPPLTATFSRVQAELGRAGTKANLISISVDPATDTPERLKSFSGKFKAQPGWTFVTGGKPEIDSLLRALGGFTADKNDHTPLVLVGNDAAGKWTRTYGLSPPSSIVKIINEAAAAKPSGVAAAASDDERKKMAEQSAKYFPNHLLVTQENQQVRFYDDLLKGKIVLINFMFTTCTGVCSPMTANLAKVQSYLGERVGREVRMLSISVDPATDTPETLKAYAARFKAGPGWYFLTGKKENVDWVLYKLGGYAEDKNTHTAALIIGNEATGEWMKVHSMSKPSDIAAAVLKLVGKETTPPSQSPQP